MGGFVAVRSSDVLVVGSGVAGLSAALAARGAAVTVVTPARLGRDGSTTLAQGGVAAALAAGDAPELHADDTLAAAAGLGVPEAVRRLTEEGPEAVQRLIALGARFDAGADGTLALGREAAHSRARIVHAGGDATGAEIARALAAAVAAASWVEVAEGVSVLRLVRSQGRVVGAVVERDGARILHLARGVILCTGGLGGIYRHTTNPPWARGQGLALASRAGALLADLEFVQFHPTALAAGDDPLPLLTEALRGAGATIVDAAGRRFLLAVDARGELAPRDVAALAIWRRLRAGEPVFLDARQAIGDRFPERFPTVFAACRARGLDPRVDRLPITPAAHYQMGGVVVDAEGRTTVPGLWAAGEVARSGVHGANRLASNSLLEGLVWGFAAGRDAAARARELPSAKVLVEDLETSLPTREGSASPGAPALLGRVRDVMWDRVGLERDGKGLAEALAELDAVEAALPARDRAGRDVVLVSRLVATAGRARTESRGAHRRADFRERDDALRGPFLLSLERDGRTVCCRRSSEALPGARPAASLEATSRPGVEARR